MSRLTWLILAGLVAAATATLTLKLREIRRVENAKASLADRIAQRRQPSPSTRVDCERFRTLQPIKLLVLGQSNAGNHGSSPELQPSGPVLVVSDRGECHRVQDPLPGATGQGASIWSRLKPKLDSMGEGRAVVMGLVAVDATTIDDWTSPNSPLPLLLSHQVKQMSRVGLAPDLVLWQQGESDARLGTSSEHYAAALVKLAEILRASGSHAKVLAANSTICRSAQSEPIRAAVTAAIARNTGIARGPDTDSLSRTEHRADGCHFSDAGLELAAQLWAESSLQYLPKSR